jgi:hypothetical protein
MSMHYVRPCGYEPPTQLDRVQRVCLRQAEHLRRHAGPAESIGQLGQDAPAETPDRRVDVGAPDFQKIDESGLGASSAKVIDQVKNPHPSPRRLTAAYSRDTSRATARCRNIQ